MGSALVFGVGTADGVETASRTMAADEYYNDLVVPAGVVLDTDGYRLFVSGVLTLDGVIANDAAGSTGASAGTVGGGSSGGTVAGQDGGALAQSLGGAGGAGSDGLGAPGGAGQGGALTAPTPPEGGPDLNLNGLAVVQGRTATGSLINGGTGGGAGGADAVDPTLAPGSGGGGGGVVVVAAREVLGNGTIRALGAAGTAGATAGGRAAGNGGGGGGGFVALLTTYIPSGVDLVATGGAGGVNLVSAAGTAGAAGITQFIIV